MNKKTPEQMIFEMHTSFFGVSGTDDKGLYGDVKMIRTHLERLNGQVSKNTFARKIGGIIILSLIGAIFSKIEGWW
uniref:Uncharacterized protein n=1 Tax=viral metagenome TaxID=1070528 RepID=A0A6H1ZGB2_9ZZZZ